MYIHSQWPLFSPAVRPLSFERALREEGGGYLVGVSYKEALTSCADRHGDYDSLAGVDDDGGGVVPQKVGVRVTSKAYDSLQTQQRIGL